jgi:hypothetical protein
MDNSRVISNTIGNIVSSSNIDRIAWMGDMDLMEKLFGKDTMKYKKYVVEIAYKDKKENIRIESKDIEWSMRQYARNREHFEWKVLNERAS